MSIFDEIGETIICLCKLKGFTQEGLALECGIIVSYLRLIEHGDAYPPSTSSGTLPRSWR